MNAARQRTALHHGDPALDEVDPGRLGQREVHVIARPVGKPALYMGGALWMLAQSSKREHSEVRLEPCDLLLLPIRRSAKAGRRALPAWRPSRRAPTGRRSSRPRDSGAAPREHYQRRSYSAGAPPARICSFSSAAHAWLTRFVIVVFPAIQDTRRSGETCHSVSPTESSISGESLQPLRQPLQHGTVA